jgi:formate dehydrogenase subunit gamma
MALPAENRVADLTAGGFAGASLWSPDDVRWMARLSDILRNRHEDVPEIRKYNAGPKGVYWMQDLLLPILLASGLVVREELFGARAGIETPPLAQLAHAVAAVIAITVIVVHAYASIRISGALRGTTRGAVTAG